MPPSSHLTLGRFRDVASIRRVVAVVSMLVGLLFAGMLAYGDYGEYQRRTQERDAMIDDFTQLATLNLAALNYQEMGPATRILLDRHGIAAVKIVDAYDYTVVQMPYAFEPSDVEELVTRDLIQQDTSPSSGEPLGMLHVWLTRSNWKQLITSALGRSVMVALAVAIAIFAIVWFYLNKYVAAPVQRMVDAMETTLATGQHALTDVQSDSLLGHAMSKFDAMQRQLAALRSRSEQFLGERQQFATELQRSLDEARSNEVKRHEQFLVLEEVLRTVQQAITYYSPEGSLIMANIGYAVEPAIAKLLSGPFPSADQIRTTLMAEGYEEIERLEVPAREGVLTETLYTMEVRNSRDAYWLVRGMELEDGTRAICFTDVTESRTMEMRLRHNQKLEALGSLTGGVAHDFNNVLAIIAGNLDLALRGSSLTQDTESKVRVARLATDRAAAVVRALLAYARMTDVEPKVVDVATVLDEMEIMLPHTLGPSIVLRTRADEAIFCRIDADNLKSGLINLAVNARDAMPNGGALEMRLTHATDEQVERANLRRRRDYACLSVTDTGTGIPKEIQERIFDPFYTTKPRGHGTGLGLSSVFGYARQFGGTLTCESTVGHGSTFRIFLPSTDAPLSERPEIPRASTGVSGYRFLVVDDEEDFSQVIVEALSQLGGHVEVAATVEEGIRLVEASGQEAPYDALLCDLLLPDGDGVPVIDCCRELTPHTRIMLLSGNASFSATPGDLDVLYEKVDMAVNKPIALSKLIEMIGQLLTSAPPGAAAR